MHEVIPDASSLIILDNIGRMGILKQVYGRLTITPEVETEFGQTLPSWIAVKKVEDTKYMRALEAIVGRGEASIIALGAETSSELLILDDQKARKLAEKIGLKYTGTVGVLLRAREKGIVRDMHQLLAELEDHGFRLSEGLKSRLLTYEDKSRD